MTKENEKIIDKKDEAKEPTELNDKDLDKAVGGAKSFGGVTTGTGTTGTSGTGF